MIEEKETLMVSPTGGDPFHKKAYFLKPINDHQENNHPPPPFNLSSTLNPKNLLPVFHAWHQHHHYLETWFNHLAPKHQSTWKNAGVYEPMISSMYRIKPKKDLLCGLAEKWSPETNTFIFPWGEATLNLEDVAVLGGFSVLGAPILSPAVDKTREMRVLEAKLEKERRGFYTATCRMATTFLWARKLMKSGVEFEHEAFLVFWLSRYVFPYSQDWVNKDVFGVAMCLAKGVRVALAPAVLASIYDNLSVLNRAVVCSNEFGPKNAAAKLRLMLQMQLVQIWAWERFMVVRPKPKVVCCGEPRMARWSIGEGTRACDMTHVRRALDSGGEGFLWRPYAIAVRNLSFPKYYVEKENWVFVDAGLDEEVLSFAMFLRVGELVGFQTNQKYLPHRVARQFGFDQDLPASVSGHGRSYENVKLYIPSRLSEADVTVRYLNWWNESLSGAQQKCRNCEGFRQPYVGSNDGEHSLVPPGFSHKRNMLEAGVLIDEDDLTISEALILKKKLKTVETTSSGCLFGKLESDSINSASSDEKAYVNTAKTQRLEEQLPFIWGGKGKRRMKTAMRYKARGSTSFDNRKDSCGSPAVEYRASELQVKIERLENLVQMLKENTFGRSSQC